MPGRISIMDALSSVGRFSLTMCDDMFHDRGALRAGLRAATGCLCAWLLVSMPGVLLTVAEVVQAAEPLSTGSLPPPAVRLNLSEAVTLFLKQNLDLIIAKYGIEY